MREGRSEKIEQPSLRVGWSDDQVLGASPGLEHFKSVEEFVTHYAEQHGIAVWCSFRVFDSKLPFYRDNTHIAIGYPDGRPAIIIPLEQLPSDWREDARKPLEKA